MEDYQRYWLDYYNDKNTDSQNMIKRSKNGIPIDSKLWLKTLEYIFDTMQINPSNKSDKVIDLCCGNGLIALPLSEKVGTVIGIDFSKPMIDELNEAIHIRNITNIVTVNADILNNDKKWSESIDKIFMYFSLQHFNHQQVLFIMSKAFCSLVDGGIFFIGDIPDLNRIWKFVCTDDYENQFFDRLKEGRPSIGTWFDSEFLLKMAKYVGFSSAKLVLQPEWQFNSHYRFDIILKK